MNVFNDYFIQSNAMFHLIKVKIFFSYLNISEIRMGPKMTPSGSSCDRVVIVCPCESKQAERRFAWPLCKDDTPICEVFHTY